MNEREKREAATNIYGQYKGERVSEYFDFKTTPEKYGYRVTRGELAAIIARLEEVRRAESWRGLVDRLMRWLRRPKGSPPVDATGREL